MLRVQDTSQVASLGTLEGQSSNQSSSDTATVLGRQNLDWVVLLGVSLLRPVENLAQGLCATGLEVRVLVEDGSVSTDMARLVVLLLANSRDTAGREPGSSCSDELCQSADQLKLRHRRLDVELRLESIVRLLKVLEGVPRWFISLRVIIANVKS